MKNLQVVQTARKGHKMSTVYNYNLNKDLRALQGKIKDLEQIKPFVNKAKNKIISNKIRELNKQIKLLER